jgi:hypothetical protein
VTLGHVTQFDGELETMNIAMKLFGRIRSFKNAVIFSDSMEAI